MEDGRWKMEDFIALTKIIKPEMTNDQ